MKIAICYPPLKSKKGIPLLSQNRQFQWFHSPTFIYPLIAAYAATMLKKAGHQVIWLDGIAQQWTLKKWLNKIKKFQPDLIVMETKTPVIKKHWKIINQLKSLSIIHYPLSIVLVGDHVTALPQESFKNAKVDYVLTGGDWDFLLLNLVNHLTKKEKLEPGIYWKKKTANSKFKILNSGQFQLNHNLNKLPFIDRDLTCWPLYGFKNGNYKHLPGTYIMAGRDCWHRKSGGCAFCAWTVLYPSYRTRTPKNVLQEIEMLINQYGFKEIMDDTGTFPTGKWLTEFCLFMIKKGFNKKINFDCNMRFGVLTKKDYFLMAKAGFRLLLFGLESASQKTINQLNKNIKVSQVEKELKIIKEVNQKTKGHLEPHLTFMIGYPWETKKEALTTLNLAKKFFQQGLIDSLQATIIIPYPGTKLFAQAKKKGWLKTLDWNKYDMKQTILKNPLTDKEIFNLTQKIYQSFITPRFFWKKITSIKSIDDLKFYFRAAKQILGHLLDFR